MQTQARAYGAFTGRRYGSFAGKAATAEPRPVGVFTHPRAFGVFTGRRYGSFADRTEQVVVPPVVVQPVNTGTRPRRFVVPRSQAQLEDEELLLIISAALHVIDPPL